MIVKQVILGGGWEVKNDYPPFYRGFFHDVNLLGKVFLGHSASRDIVITRFGHYKNCFQSLALFLRACDEQLANGIRKIGK